MAKEQLDRTTPDLFSDEKRPGRPKTSLLNRKTQLKINKRNQLKRDKQRGLKRIELKLPQDHVELLDELAKQYSINRSELVIRLLTKQFLSQEKP